MTRLGKLRKELPKELPWYGPGAFAIATCLVVLSLIFLIRARTFDERTEKIKSDLDTIVTSLEGQVASVRDFLVLMSEEFSDGRLDEETFLKRAERFLSENEELANIRYIDGSSARKWVAPESSKAIRGTEISRSELLRAYKKASTDSKPSFSKPYTSYSGSDSVSIFVPSLGKTSTLGAFAAEIDLTKLIRLSVADKLSNHYAIELVGEFEEILARLRVQDHAISALSDSGKIRYFDNLIGLRIARYEDPFDFQFFGLTSLCIGLALGLAWAMWMLGKDNHQRKRIQIELERTKNAAEAANNAKSELIANISHEIRTPLGAIQGFADLLVGVRQSPADRQKSIYAIRRNSRNLLELINDLLDLSKIEAGLLEIEKVNFFIGDKVSEALELFGAEAKRKGVSLKAKYLGPIPQTICSDPKRIGQILINLIGNAVKFTESGEVVLTVALTGEEEGKPFLSFEIRDTGIGMTDQQIKRLFKPFTQADSSISRKYGGTGLGLSLSKKLCEKLGGTIKLKNSRIGVGSTFEARIDPGDLSNVQLLAGLRQVVDPVLNDDSIAITTRLDGVRVLIVEDCRDNQVIYTQFVESAGGSVETADDGIEGVAKARADKFDVILLDIQMPEMDGYSTARKLREQKIETPIIALTAHAMKGERERCIEAGANEYLTKPVEPEVLTGTIGAYAEAIKIDARRPELSVADVTPDQAVDDEGPLFSKFSKDPRVMPVLPGFVEGLQGRVNRLRNAAESEDWAEVRKVAHSFKGTASNYGFPEIAQHASEIEYETLNEKNMHIVLSRLDILEKLSARALKAVVIS